MEDDIGRLSLYTFWPARKTYSEEWGMVQDALEGEEGVHTLQEYLEPLASIMVERFLALHPRLFERELELHSAAYLPLSAAVQAYKEEKSERGIPSKFSTYYEWFMRQAIHSYSSGL